MRQTKLTNMSKNLNHSDFTHDKFKNLAYAIIARAIEDLINDSKDSRPHKRDASRWLTSNNTEPFSFLWICEKVDLDVEFLYESIRKLSQPKT